MTPKRPAVVVLLGLSLSSYAGSASGLSAPGTDIAIDRKESGPASSAPGSGEAGRAPGSPSAGIPDPWSRIETLRNALAESGPLAARFTQTYVPQGFSSGESESGTLYLALPDCLRWDYDEPYPKSFLLCGQDVYAWNRGETVGRHSRVDARAEAGLDLLLLSVEELRTRYQADAGAAPGEISLAPLRAPSSAPAQASLEVDARGTRLTGLSYRDREGNLTRFTLGDYRPRAAAEKDVFQPPPAVSWQDQ